MSADAPKIPATCERRGCDEPVCWALHWEEHGAPEPAFACWNHGLRSQVRRERIEDYAVASHA